MGSTKKRILQSDNNPLPELKAATQTRLWVVLTIVFAFWSPAAPEGEWQYARRPSERDVISYLPDNYDPLVASGQMTLLKGGEQIVPGISVKAFPGHTDGMQAVIVNGRLGFERARLPAAPLPATRESGALAPQGATACYISDLIPTTAHLDITWGMSFDLYPSRPLRAGSSTTRSRSLRNG